MSNPQRILKWSLLAGAVYFLGIALVHMLGIKIPLLFIYFNVPSHAYQDRIISFLAFGWAVFLYTAFTDPKKQAALVRAILVAGAGAIVGLSIINLTTDFQAYDPALNSAVFWGETAGVFVYWLWLVIFYVRGRA